MPRSFIRTTSLAVALFAVGCHFNFDRQLSPGEIRGRLLLEDDAAKRKPATDAHVSVVGSPINVATDSSGRFIVRGLPVGTFQLRVTRDLAGTGKQTTILNIPDIRLDAVAGKPGARDLGDVVVAGLGSVHGTMTRNGEIVSGIRVVLKELTEVVASMGVFTLEDLPAGKYPVFIVDETGKTLKGAVGHDLVVQVLPRRATPLAIELNDLIPATDGTVAGHVYVSSGGSAGGIQVKLTDEHQDVILATTNEDGLYTGDGPAGVYTLEATKEGYSNSYIQYFVVDGATAAPDMMLVGADTAGLTCGPDPTDSVATGCGLHATCADASGTRTCTCVTGYSGDGRSCADVDECATATSCDANATCANTVGSFSCTCLAGFTGDGHTCTDVDECADGNNGGCSTNATCTNTAGARTCACNQNYVGDGITCAVGDACVANNGGCDAHANCTTVSSQASCACQTGWHGDGHTCLPNYVSASSGGAATCAIKADGTLWCWGTNSDGQVGDGTGIDRVYASLVDPTHTWQSIAGGDTLSCAIRTDGTLWCWGSQSAPPAGPSRTANRSLSEGPPAHYAPEQIGQGTSWVSLSLGTSISCGIQTGGVLVCWYDTFSEYSDGAMTFTTIAGAHPWSQVSVGDDHICGLQNDGTLWCWGGNKFGQAGEFDTSFVSDPFEAGGSDHWQSVNAGTDHTCAVKNDGTLWCWGKNNVSQLGEQDTSGSASALPLDTATDWRSVSAGNQFTCALKADQSLWCWGSDYYGELGDGFQDSNFGTPKTIAGQWSNVFAGGSHACGLKTDGSLWCWGDNVGGDLGNGDTIAPDGPVSVVLFNTDFCATDNGGCLETAYCSQTPSGTGGAASHACTCDPGYEGNGVDACTIINRCDFGSCDVNGTCTPVLNGVTCACQTGFNGSGDPGTCVPNSCATAPEGWCDANATCASTETPGSTTCTCSPGYAGDGRHCTLSDPCQINGGGCDAHATCTNENPTAVCTCADGWSGDGHTCLPNYVQVGTGEATSCSVKKDGSLWCWGTNAQGQVGDGSGVDRYYPSLVTATPEWTQVEAGGGFTCGIKTDGTLWCWGGYSNAGGPPRSNLRIINSNQQLVPEQLGTETTWTSISLGSFGACGLQTGGLLVCFDPSGNSNPGQTDADGGVTAPFGTAVAGNHPWTQVSVGGDQACGLQDDGSLWCWGYNYYGQIGFYDGYDSPAPYQLGTDSTWLNVASGGDHNCAVRSDHTLWCWGRNSASQLGVTPDQGDAGTIYSSGAFLQVGTDTDWSLVSAGAAFSCGLKSSGALSCWGNDSAGELGDGAHPEFTTATPVTVPGIWTTISSAGAHSCGLLNKGKLQCWGDNAAGDLGTGTADPSSPGDVYNFASDPCATNNGGCVAHAFCTQTPPTGDATTASVTCDCLRYYDGDGNVECVLQNLCSDGTGESPPSCDSHATCTPEPGTYACDCQEGFSGYGYYEGGCQPNDCAAATTSGWCDVHASCNDVEGISCICNNGFVGDGRTCAPGYQTISAGYRTTCSIKGDGTLWCWGANQTGTVGDGSGVNRTFPSQVDAATDWTSVSTGSGYTCATKSNGTLWCWGGQNQLSGPANGVTTPTTSLIPSAQLTPKQVGTDTTWTKISVGGLGACGLQSGSGALVCVTLGNAPIILTEDGGTATGPTVTTIPGANGWTDVSVGGGHACGLQTDGSLWCWGSNYYGQAGSTPGPTVTDPIQVDSSSTWTSVACGSTHTCAVKSDGSLWCWGSNFSGELASGNGQSGDGGGVSSTSTPLQVGTDTTWSRVAAGGNFTCGLQSSQNLYCWGQNYYGQLGSNAFSSTTPNAILQNGSFTAVATGTAHVCALQAGGTLVCWGENNSGQLGNGFNYNTSQQQPVYNFESDGCVVNNGGCGANTYCTLSLAMGEGNFGGPETQCACDSGYEGDPIAGCTLVDYCALGEANCDSHATCTPVPNDYSCTCQAGFIGSAYGQGSCVPQDCTVAAATNWCDTNATCSTVEGSGVTCACNAGYLGDGTTCAAGFTSIEAGLNGTVCGQKVDGTLWCWGNNNTGTVGDGSQANRSYASEVTTATSWTSYSTGGNYTFATKADGTLWWWGGSNNSEGASPNGSVYQPALLPRLRPLQYDEATDWVSVSTGGSQTCALRTGGKLSCWDMAAQQAPTPVDDTKVWTAVSVGDGHTCALQDDHSLWCWGYNYYGEAGAPLQTYTVSEPYNPDPESQWSSVATGGYHTCAVKLDGTLWCWGSNYNEQLGLDNGGGDGPTRVSSPTQLGLETSWVSVSAGSDTTCALKGDGTAWCWGSDYWGALGGGQYQDGNFFVPVQVSGAWSTVSTGNSFSCGLQGARAFCWGYGYGGALGNGSETVTGYPQEVYEFASDPCATNNGGCSSGAYCTNTPNQTSCDCLPGFSGEGGLNCTLIDYCVVNNGAQNCDVNATCNPVPNNYYCSCNAGFLGDGYSGDCVPQDCAAASTAGWCDANAACTDSGLPDGHTSCACHDGYTGDGRTCTNAYKDVFAGLNSTTCAFKGDGTLWCWGENGRAEVGDGSLTTRYYPAEVTTDTTWTSVSAGNSYTFATRADGSLWWWGGADNTDGAPASSHTPVPVALLPQLTPKRFDDSTSWQTVSMGWEACGLQTGGVLLCWDQYNQAPPEIVPGNNPWKAVSVGEGHTCALQTDDSLWCWGHNYYGEVGVPLQQNFVASPTPIASESTWRAVSAGGTHTCGLKTDGTLWCWGSNYSQQTGTDNGGGEGPNFFFTPAQVGSLTTWTAISSGGNMTCALQGDDSLWCWGGDSEGELGNGFSGSSTPIPTMVSGSWKRISCGGNYACGLHTDGSLVCWGGNGGQLGIGTVDETVAAPTEVYNFASDPCAVNNGNCAEGVICSNLPSGAICGGCLQGYQQNETTGTCTLIDYCVLNGNACDSNATCTPVRNNALCTCNEGYTGNGRSCVPTDCAAAANVGWCDPNATCTDSGQPDGSTACHCAAGFLGDGRTCVREYTSVEAGNTTSCAIKSDQSLWCWGANDLGQVGDGSGLDKPYPSQVGTSTWTTASTGYGYTCGIQTNGSLWCWGGHANQTTGAPLRSLGASAQLTPLQVGSSTAWASVSVGDYEACAIDVEGTLSCWDPGNPSGLAVVAGDSPWMQVSVGYRHVCGVQTNGTLWCWGNNSYGEVGLTTDYFYVPAPSQVSSGLSWHSVAAGNYHSCAVANDHSLWCWGENYNSELGVNPGATQTYTSSSPLQVGTDMDWAEPGAGNLYSCGLKTNQILWCWGFNNAGVFANGRIGDTTASPIQVTGATWTKVAIGQSHACGIDTSGYLYCWGQNQQGDLGDGNTGLNYPYLTAVYNFANDPCVSNNGGCAATGGACTHTPYQTTCGCLSGYSGDGTTCDLINLCKPTSCDSNATCSPVPNDFVCTCNAPLTGSGYYQGGCAPVDCSAAAELNWCDSNAICINDGGVYCSCNGGWTGDGRSCVPRDCGTAAQANWCSPNASCYADGQVYCQCDSGYEGDGRSCVDVDECQNNPCASNAACTNTPGSYTCACRAGFAGDGYQICVDQTAWAQWPMPDSQTSVCTDGTATPTTCPLVTDSLGDQDGVVSGRPGLTLNMDAMGQDDPATGLEWSLQVNLNVLADKTPANICDGLPTLGGLSWRVPSLTELLTLVDYGQAAAKFGWIASPGVPSGALLSSTAARDGSGTLAFDADTGVTLSIASDKDGSVMCVR